MEEVCQQTGIHSVSPSVSEGVNFVGMLFSARLGYSAICVARSALSSYLDCKDAAQFGEHKRVRQFIKGVFEKKPALPKYSSTWDVDIVLQYLELHYPHDELTLKKLSYKLVMLLALLSGQRCQTLHCLSVSSVKMGDSKRVWMYYLNSLAKENIWHLWSFWLSLIMKKCALCQY